MALCLALANGLEFFAAFKDQLVSSGGRRGWLSNMEGARVGH
jgi:hypothetical protein